MPAPRRVPRRRLKTAQLGTGCRPGRFALLRERGATSAHRRGRVLVRRALRAARAAWGSGRGRAAREKDPRRGRGTVRMCQVAVLGSCGRGARGGDAARGPEFPRTPGAGQDPWRFRARGRRERGTGKGPGRPPMRPREGPRRGASRPAAPRWDRGCPAGPGSAERRGRGPASPARGRCGTAGAVRPPGIRGPGSRRARRRAGPSRARRAPGCGAAPRRGAPAGALGQAGTWGKARPGSPAVLSRAAPRRARAGRPREARAAADGDAAGTAEPGRSRRGFPPGGGGYGSGFGKQMEADPSACPRLARDLLPRPGRHREFVHALTCTRTARLGRGPGREFRECALDFRVSALRPAARGHRPGDRVLGRRGDLLRRELDSNEPPFGLRGAAWRVLEKATGMAMPRAGQRVNPAAVWDALAVSIGGAAGSPVHVVLHCEEWRRRALRSAGALPGGLTPGARTALEPAPGRDDTRSVPAHAAPVPPCRPGGDGRRAGREAARARVPARPPRRVGCRAERVRPPGGRPRRLLRDAGRVRAQDRGMRRDAGRDGAQEPRQEPEGRVPARLRGRAGAAGCRDGGGRSPAGVGFFGGGRDGTPIPGRLRASRSRRARSPGVPGGRAEPVRRAAVPVRAHGRGGASRCSGGSSRGRGAGSPPRTGSSAG